MGERGPGGVQRPGAGADGAGGQGGQVQGSGGRPAGVGLVRRNAGGGQQGVQAFEGPFAAGRRARHHRRGEAAGVQQHGEDAEAGSEPAGGGRVLRGRRGGEDQVARLARPRLHRQPQVGAGGGGRAEGGVARVEGGQLRHGGSDRGGGVLPAQEAALQVRGAEREEAADAGQEGHQGAEGSEAAGPGLLPVGHEHLRRVPGESPRGGPARVRPRVRVRRLPGQAARRPAGVPGVPQRGHQVPGHIQRLVFVLFVVEGENACEYLKCETVIANE